LNFFRTHADLEPPRLAGLVKIIPVSLKIASACGIGLFLALIGLSGPTGIGAVSGGKTTPLQIAGCPNEYLKDGICVSHKMTSPAVSQKWCQQGNDTY
jgi:AGZA family xanthine/uracil permease-like MFS transporter